MKDYIDLAISTILNKLEVEPTEANKKKFIGELIKIDDSYSYEKMLTVYEEKLSFIKDIKKIAENSPNKAVTIAYFLKKLSLARPNEGFNLLIFSLEMQGFSYSFMDLCEQIFNSYTQTQKHTIIQEPIFVKEETKETLAFLMYLEIQCVKIEGFFPILSIYLPEIIATRIKSNAFSSKKINVIDGIALIEDKGELYPIRADKIELEDAKITIKSIDEQDCRFAFETTGDESIVKSMKNYIEKNL